MRSMRISVFAWLNVVVVIVCLSVTLVAQPALAVNDCSDASYVQAFDARLGGGACEEVARIPIPFRGGRAVMRVLRTPDVVMDARTNALIGWLRDVAGRTGESMNAMGGLELDDVSILMTGFSRPSDGADAMAMAIWPNPAYSGQCLIPMFLGDFDEGAEQFEFYIAHEIFHCIQFKTWDYGPATAGAYWWAEGSAEYFAALTIPEADGPRDSIEHFDERSSDQSLLSMSYENVVLFSWVGGRANPSGVKHTLDILAEARTSGAVADAAERAFGRDNLLAFAQDYLDSAIALPHGRAMQSSPRIPTQEADRPLHLAGDPFVVVRGQINYEAGRYENRVDVREGRYQAAREPRTWAALPGDLNIECNAETSYVFAAFSTLDAGVDIEVTPNNVQERTCVACGAAARERRQRNSCLVGTWHFAGHQNFCANFAARVAESGARVLECIPGTSDVTFSADGTAVARASGQSIFVQLNSEMTMRTQQDVVGNANWSTEDGEVTFCEAASTMTGMTTINANGLTTSSPIDQSTPPEDGSASFVCTATTLTVLNHEAPAAFLGIGPEMVLQRVR